jgi:hypothetical protein
LAVARLTLYHSDLQRYTAEEDTESDK